MGRRWHRVEESGLCLSHGFDSEDALLNIILTLLDLQLVLQPSLKVDLVDQVV